MDQTHLFTCAECGLRYKEKTWADQCQTWCREHHSCNLGIIRHAEPQDESQRTRTK